MTVDRRRQARRQSEAGSVLLLMPVAVLIVVILGSLAVDRAVIFGAQRDLVAAAQVAANDAAGLGVDPDSLHGDGRISYDGTRIDQAVRAAVQGTDGQVQAHWSIRNGEVVVASNGWWTWCSPAASRAHRRRTSSPPLPPRSCGWVHESLLTIVVVMLSLTNPWVERVDA